VLNYKLSKEAYFDFNSHSLEYFFHSYNNFRLTERAIEIPIIKFYLEQEGYQQVLEIGNVTNYYYDYFREVFVGKRKVVVDKFEVASDVISMDICKYKPNTRFDFVFSISTFEHMDSDRGRNPDYEPDSSNLISVAADNISYVLDFLLKKGGKFVITAPLGYSEEWDETFYSTTLDGYSSSSRCKRYVFEKQKEIVWKEIEVSKGRGAIYNFPLPGVNYLSIVEFDK